MNFTSPSRGSLSLDEAFADIIAYIDDKPKEQYKLIIGTDSHAHYRQDVCFVTAIIIHRVGKGARYFFRRQKHRYMESLRQRIYYETFLSLEVATLVTAKLAENGHSCLNMEVHLDVGEKGDTRELIREVVGMVIGSGFHACIKPESYGASTVADKYTK
ncbi:MAG: ribonuclease H-like YkuK family protein [Clostridiales bacterium]|jgi:predicted RNase H-related nuclease YkuK (DUF458 family)|nr:ribonuclease H-like YkuK family protein [Clostridiales bacterium]